MDKKAALIWLATRKQTPAIEWFVYLDREDSPYLITQNASFEYDDTPLPADGTKIYVKLDIDWSQATVQPTSTKDYVEIVVANNVEQEYASNGTDYKIGVKSNYNAFYKSNVIAITKVGSRFTPAIKKIYWAYA